jgi:putative ABC transport system permease protein
LNLLAYLRSLISSLFERPQLDRELDEELLAHIQQHADDLQRSGIPRDEAERRARIAFGAYEKAKESVREQRPGFFLETLASDARFALRILRKSPGFTLVALLTLTLGIGANTAIFELLDAIRLRSLPIQNPQQLAEIQIVGGNNGIGINQEFGVLTRPIYQEILDRQQAFSGAFAWKVMQRYTGQGADMRRFRGLWVTGNFFPILGVQPWRGRLLQPQDEGSCPVTHAVISYGYWQNALGGRDLAQGIKLIADNDLIEVVGVTPPNFFGMIVGNDFDIALPFCRPSEPLRRDVFEVTVMGRLKPGWSVERASTELAVLSPAIFEDTVLPGRDPEVTDMYKKFRLAAVPAQTGVSALRDYDRSLYLLLGIAGLVLVIACANLASLMLARASSRQNEIAVRMALGASRGRVLRQLLMESVLLASTGAGFGIALAQVLGRVLVWQISTEGNAVNLQLVTDWRVLLFATAVAALTCIFFGVAPGLRATRTDPVVAMKSGGRATAGLERLSLQRFMVVAQISVSLVLLVGALLFVRSFRNLVTCDPGMRESGITAAFLGFWQSKMPEERWFEFQRELLEEIQSVPGVLNAAATTNMPLSGQSWTLGVHVQSAQGDSKFTWISPDYFDTMAIPVLKGRGISREDAASSPHVAVVNETFVRRFLAGTNPLGKTLRTEAEPNYPSAVYEIVGVIPDTRYDSLRSETPPIAFAPITQYPNPGPWSTLVVHSNIPTDMLSAAVKRKLAEKHPDVLAEFFDFQRAIRDSLLQERLMAMLSGFFGALAALLTMIGVYGVISYLVVARRNEIGIRVALGARRWNVVCLVLRQTLIALSLGLVIGILLALIATRGAATLLYGLQPNDAQTYAAAIALLIVMALTGSLLPARRAASTDPIDALRYE